MFEAVMVCTLLNVRISTSFSALQAPHRMNKESSRASCKQAVDGSVVASQLLVGHAIGDAARDHTHTATAATAARARAIARVAATNDADTLFVLGVSIFSG